MNIFTGVFLSFAIFSGLIAWHQYNKAEALQKQVNVLQLAVQEQSKTIAEHEAQAKYNEKIMQDLGEANNEIEQQTKDMERELNSLRVQAMVKTLSEPFRAGLDTDGRRHAILLRFDGKAGDTDQNGSGISKDSPASGTPTN